MTTVFVLIGFGCLFLLPLVLMLIVGFVHLLQDVVRGYLDECNELGLVIVSMLGIACLFAALILYDKCAAP